MPRRRLVHVSGYTRRFPRLGEEPERTRYDWADKPKPIVGDDEYQGRLWSGGPASPREKAIMAANAQANMVGQQVGQYVATTATTKKESSGWVWLLLLLAMRNRR